jgi:hypothetical protein
MKAAISGVIIFSRTYGKFLNVTQKKIQLVFVEVGVFDFVDQRFYDRFLKASFGVDCCKNVLHVLPRIFYLNYIADALSICAVSAD